MARFVLSFAAALALVPGLAGAAEFKNIRPSYGPLGAVRTDNKFLPGDVVYVTYDIDGLKLDKDGKAVYVTLLEVFDASTKSIHKKENLNESVPELGGNRIPGDLQLELGGQAPGKYIARVAVRDEIAKELKSFSYPFEVLPKGFGTIRVSAPGVAFPGLPYVTSFAVVGLGLDASKKPKARIEMKVLDEAGKTVHNPPANELPRDLPDTLDLSKEVFVPIHFPILPNRAGRFQVDISINDQVGQNTATIRYPLVVIDLANLTGK